MSNDDGPARGSLPTERSRFWRLLRGHTPRSRSGGAAALSLLALVVAGNSSSWAAEYGWAARLEFEERYDDNITQLSQKDLDRLTASGGGLGYGCGSTSADTSGGRFTITKPDDFVAIPQLSSSLRAGWLPGAPTGFGFELSAYKYSTNDIKSYQSYRLWATQALHPATGHSTILALSYDVTPSYYLRNLRSDRTAENLAAIGIFALPPPRREATYHKDTVQARLDQEIVTGRLRFVGTLGREVRNYNPCFDERDSRMPLEEADLIWEPLGNEHVRFRVTFRREDQHAHGDLLDTPDFTEDDISSRRDIVAGEIRVRWGSRGRRKTVRFHYEGETRAYMTTNPNDIFHFGRHDKRRYVTLSGRMDLSKEWFFVVEGERDSNRSSFPTTPGSGFQPEDTTDYDENLVQFGFGYTFGTAGSGETGRLPGTPRE